MKRAVLVLSVLAILLLLSSVLSFRVFAQEATEVPVIPTIDPLSCQKHFLNVSKGTTVTRYYLYQSKWLMFSTRGVSGSVTFNSEVWDIDAYRVNVDFSTGAVSVVGHIHVDAGQNYTFTVDNTAQELVIVFDCLSSVSTTLVEGSGLYDVVTNSCLILNRIQLNGTTLPAIYTFENMYILPIFNVAGPMSITSAIQPASVHRRIDVSSWIGQWFDEGDPRGNQGLKDGAKLYQSNQNFAVPLTSFVTSANVSAGDASLTAASCTDVAT